MADPFVLLRIAADLHAAGRDPGRWPQAWQAVCAHFACPNILGDGIPDGLAPSAALSHVADRTARARACVEARTGACARVPNDPRFRACCELLPHIEMALADARPATNGGDPRLAALDVLPFPVFVCDSQRRLLHTNAAGRDELHRRRWLRQDEDRLLGATSPIESRLAATLSIDNAGDQHLTLLRADDAGADLLVRQVVGADGNPHWVLRLIHHTRESDDGKARLTAMLGLTPRQAELAQLLIAGCTLTDAARRMGIVRGSANDLLKRLFSITGTRRQAELVGLLNRRLANR